MEILCSKCGKKLLPTDVFCGNCGAAIQAVGDKPADTKAVAFESDGNEAAYSQMIQDSKKEKYLFYGSTFAGVMLGFNYAIMAVTDDTFNVVGAIILGIMMVYVAAAGIYTALSRHYLRRIIGYIIVAWPMVAVGYLFIALFFGAFFYYPRAIYRLVKKIPLRIE